MNFRDRRSLKKAADRSIAASSYDPRKLMLIYFGASAVLMLSVMALNFILQNQIAGTGGLSGMGLRSVLETVSQVVQTAVNLLLPFWTMGYLYCVLKMIRGEKFGLSDMLYGFRNFGPVLRLNLIRGLILSGMAFACLYLAMGIFVMSPLAEPANAILAPYLENAQTGGDVTLLLDDAAVTALGWALLPGLGIFAVLLLVLVVPRYYGMRMADFALLDEPKAGAMMAIRRSRAMLDKNRLALVRLDLSFWWFYLLDCLLLCLCYGDLLLPMLGVELPFDADAAFFLFYVLYLATQAVLYVLARNKVECTYAVGYEILNGALNQKLERS